MARPRRPSRSRRGWPPPLEAIDALGFSPPTGADAADRDRLAAGRAPRRPRGARRGRGDGDRGQRRDHSSRRVARGSAAARGAPRRRGDGAPDTAGLAISGAEARPPARGRGHRGPRRCRTGAARGRGRRQRHPAGGSSASSRMPRRVSGRDPPRSANGSAPLAGICWPASGNSSRVARSALVHRGAAVLAGWTLQDEIPRCRRGWIHSARRWSSSRRHPAAWCPTLITGTRASRPFRPLVDTYATVPYADVDPSIFAGAAYILMFGMMFGDVAHGLILAALGLYVRGLAPAVLAPFRKVWPIVFGAGLSAAAFGFFYGEAFGPQPGAHALAGSARAAGGTSRCRRPDRCGAADRDLRHRDGQPLARRWAASGPVRFVRDRRRLLLRRCDRDRRRRGSRFG